MSHRLFFDGSLNKCIVGYGIVIYKDEEIIFKSHGFHKDPALSNNVAEFLGLIIGLTKALELGIREISVFGDSRLVIGQMMGDFKVKAISMKPCYCVAKMLEKQFDKVNYEWVPRKLNSVADKEMR